METLSRLAWALPLVLLIGIAIMLALKRFIVPARVTSISRETQRMSVRESISLSDDTRAHLIEVDGHAYLVVDSSRQVTLQSVAARAAETARLPTRVGPPWLQRFYKAQTR